MQAVLDFTRTNIAELIEEMRPEAERVTAELIEARAKLAPFVTARAELAAKVNALTACVHRGRGAPEPQYVGGIQINGGFRPRDGSSVGVARGRGACPAAL